MTLKHSNKQLVVNKSQPAVEQNAAWLSSLSSVFDKLTTAVFISSSDGTIVYANPVLMDILVCRDIETSACEVMGCLFETLSDNKPLNPIDKVNENGDWSGTVSVRARQSNTTIECFLKITQLAFEKHQPVHYVGMLEQVQPEALESSLSLVDKRYILARMGVLTDQLFIESLQGKLEETNRDSHRFLKSVMLLKLNNFSEINQISGKEVIDSIISSFAEKLKAYFDDDVIIGFLRDDEFVLYFNKIETNQHLIDIYEDLESNFGSLFYNKELGYEYYVPFSLGVSLFPRDAESAEELIEKARFALKYAQYVGDGNHQFYDQQLFANVSQKLKVEAKLEQAIINGTAFELHYQPKISFETGKIIGVEALLRWHDDELGNIAPGFFIPVAEQSNLINLVGDWVLHKACQQFSYWQKQNIDLGVMSINVSAKQLSKKTSFISNFIAYLNKYNLSPENFEIEITETAMADETVCENLESLKNYGISIAVDDFCTGYSNLHDLKHYPVDVIKIDKSFIAKLADSLDMMLAESIIDIAHKHDLVVVAEGIETKSQEAILAEFGCDIAQGFLYARPMSAEKLAEWLASKHSHTLLS